MQDWLVCNESIQHQLLAKADLFLATALELAQGMEAAEQNAKSLKSTGITAIHKLNTKRNQACSL